MRTRKYKIGYNGDLTVVKGPIDSFNNLGYDRPSGMYIIANLDDKKPMVEYGVIGWAHGKEIPADNIIKTDNWEFYGSETDGYGEDWDYYISKPVQTFTKNEIQEMFEKYFAPFINESDTGKAILEEFFERESDMRFKDV